MFLPVLTSAETYRQGYRYRLLIEAAGILESSFALDRESQPTISRGLDNFCTLSVSEWPYFIECPFRGCYGRLLEKFESFDAEASLGRLISTAPPLLKGG